MEISTKTKNPLELEGSKEEHSFHRHTPHNSTQDAEKLSSSSLGSPVLPNDHNNNDSNDDIPILSTTTSWWRPPSLSSRKTTTMTPRPMKERNTWLALLLGQVIALVATSMNAASYVLSAHHKVETQLFQLFVMYALLSVNLLWRQQHGSPSSSSSSSSSQHSPQPQHQQSYVTVDHQDDQEDDHGEDETDQYYYYRLPRLCGRRNNHAITIRLCLPWWTYLIMSILDIIPNYLQLFSFRYTSLTSTTLLGSLTVPSTMFFSRLFFRGRCFGASHYLGVLLCVLGGGLTVWTDLGEQASSSAVHSGQQLVGDILAVVAAMIYGLGDVISEYCVKHLDLHELLGMYGLYGAIITGLTFPWMEYEALSDLYHRSRADQWEIWGIFSWYIASVLSYYLAEAFFLVGSDATLLNLSMQASNLWAILFSLIAYHTVPPWLFYPALVLVVAGVALYEWKPTTTTTALTTSSSFTSPGSPHRSSSSNDDDDACHESAHFAASVIPPRAYASVQTVVDVDAPVVLHADRRGEAGASNGIV